MENFSLQEFDQIHNQQTEEYARYLDFLFWTAVGDLMKNVTRVEINKEKIFSFSDYPKLKTVTEKMILDLAEKIKGSITKVSRDQWLYACKKNDEFLKHIMHVSKLPERLQTKYKDNNISKFEKFQNRTINDSNLSKRIWNYAGQLKTELELAIDVAIGDGKSAQELSRDVRKFLVDPDKLFRRVRDKHGNLKLSKAAAAYHPGKGKYRSSYKNAMRLARTEINMAYRTAEQLRWEKLDFVVGYEIRLSNNHTLNGESFVDICDQLAGRYPKSFIWKGWHPQCRCHAVPVLMDQEEFNTDELNELKAALKGTEYKKFASKNTVTDVPDAFKTWVADNVERSQNWKSQPYWIKDNFQGGTLEGGLKI